MENAEKIDLLELNKFYSVACAELNYNGNIQFVPVIPILHKDPQFGKLGSMKHYHIDGRFIRKEYIGGVFLYDGRTNQVIVVEDDADVSYKFIQLVRKKRKCIRLETGLNIDLKRPPATWSKWYKTMIGKSIKNNLCPHYGAKMIEINGRLKCPIHNLEGCPNSKKIIERNVNKTNRQEILDSSIIL